MNHLPPSIERIGNAMETVHETLFSDVSVDAIRQTIAPLIRASMIANTPARAADEITNTFLERISEIRRISLTDIAAALRGDPAAQDDQEVLQYYPGFRATVLQRIAHTLQELGVPYLPRGITEYAHRITGIDIHPGATIGEGFFIDHGTGIVIGETAQIGNNVTLYQGVTLGAKSFKHDENKKVIREPKRHPTIEDNVVIYANATILGGKTVIGEGSIIGGGVWLTESVKPGSLVFLERPSIKKKALDP